MDKPSKQTIQMASKNQNQQALKFGLINSEIKIP